MSRMSRRGCYKCGNLGHNAEKCTSATRLCYNCRQVSFFHRWKYVLLAPLTSSTSLPAQPGHESSDCPSPKSVASRQCYSCGGVGHIQSDCAFAAELVL